MPEKYTHEKILTVYVLHMKHITQKIHYGREELITDHLYFILAVAKFCDI